MMFKKRQPSIQRRLRYAMMTTAEIGLLVTLLFYSVNDYFKSRDALVKHIQNITQVINIPASTALSKNDNLAAQQALLMLKSVDTVQSAYIVNPRNQILANFSRHNSKASSINFTDHPVKIFTDQWLDVSTPIMDYTGKVVGSISARADISPLQRQIKLNILAALMITVLAIIFSYIVAFRLQRKITQPIIRLADHMRQVTVSKIYESHLVGENDDEIGQLYDQFNEMLEQVHKRDQELSTHKEELEKTVKLRTEALNIANENLKFAIDEANTAREKALDAAKAKSVFLANMSHEIRTPMNGVLGMLEMMKDTKLDDAQLDYLNTAYGSADSLLQIINDILDFSKIEAGKLELEKVDVDPSALTEDIATLLASKTREKGIELSCYTDVNLPPGIKSDPVRLRQILTNLLGNAVKFTVEGEITIRTTILLDQVPEDQKETHCCIEFSVEDTGIGIDEKVIPTLFQPFTQEDSSTTRKFGGTGLGLTISRQLVDLLGGNLQVRSTKGKGSCFYFSFLTEIVQDMPENKKEYAAMSSLKGLYALIIDDNRTNRNILCHYLESWGIDFVEAEDGIRALEKIRDAQTAGRPFQLAYLDMQMPGMDGITLSQKLRDDQSLSAIKRIMLTSTGPMTDQERHKAGLHAALAKPFRQKQLLQATLEVMALNVNQSPTPTNKQDPQACAFSADTKLLLVEDNLVNQKVTKAMLGKLGLTTDIAQNGREAVQILIDQQQTYDLVFMDCQMPEMSGYEATQYIRQHEEKKDQKSHINIVAMTANAMEGDREKCIDAGMDDYITKPIKLEILKQTLIKWLPASCQTQPEAHNNSNDAAPLINDLILSALYKKEQNNIKHLIEHYIQDSEKTVKATLAALHHNQKEELKTLLSQLRTMVEKFGAERLLITLDTLNEDIRHHTNKEASHTMLQLIATHHETNKHLNNKLQELG